MTALLAVLPYLCVAALLVGAGATLMGFARGASTRSTRLLESRLLFWGLVPLHAGIGLVLLGHVAFLLFPALGSADDPLQLLALESALLAAGLLASVGVLALAARRIACSAVRIATGTGDVAALALLGFQIATGVYLAVACRWSLAWLPELARQYLLSLARMSPDNELIAAFPLPVRLHLLGAWLLLASIPFTRLAHALTPPWRIVLPPRPRVAWSSRPASPPEER